MARENLSAYHAAELFHLPARLFNAGLVKNLEANEVKVFSPQRDGFEFTQLVAVLTEELFSPKALDEAMQAIIYAYDILALSQVDVVVARFDEPADRGVDKEVAVADTLGIPVIPYRTDVRSPYGALSDKYGGMNTFSVRESDVIIFQKSTLSPEKDLESLSEKLIREIKKTPLKRKQVIPDFLQQTFKVAHTLFDGIADIHSAAGLAELAQRCVENEKKLSSFGPRPIRGF